MPDEPWGSDQRQHQCSITYFAPPLSRRPLRRSLASPVRPSLIPTLRIVIRAIASPAYLPGRRCSTPVLGSTDANRRPLSQRRGETTEILATSTMLHRCKRVVDTELLPGRSPLPDGRSAAMRAALTLEAPAHQLLMSARPGNFRHERLSGYKVRRARIFELITGRRKSQDGYLPKAIHPMPVADLVWLPGA